MKKCCLLIALALLLGCLPGALGEAGVTPGDHVHFGRYEFDGNPENGPEPLEWRVLAVEGDQALLITAYIIDGHAIDDAQYTQKTKPWPQSPIRKWLNGEFMDLAFSPEEKAAILTVTNKTEKNPDYNTGKVADSKDQVFYLSLAEAEKYFADDNDRMVRVTPYGASLCIVPCGTISMYHSFMPLRNYGARHNLYASTKPDGMIMTYGMMLTYVRDHPVRPAIRVKADVLTPLPPAITVLGLGQQLHWTPLASAASYQYEIADSRGQILSSGRDILQDFAQVNFYQKNEGEEYTVSVTALDGAGNILCRESVRAVWNAESMNWQFFE